MILVFGIQIFRLTLYAMKCDAKIIQLSFLWAGYQFTRGREGVDKKFDEIVSSSLFMHYQPPLSILCSRYGHKDVNAATAQSCQMPRILWLCPSGCVA